MSISSYPDGYTSESENSEDNQFNAASFDEAEAVVAETENKAPFEVIGTVLISFAPSFYMKQYDNLYIKIHNYT